MIRSEFLLFKLKFLFSLNYYLKNKDKNILDLYFFYILNKCYCSKILILIIKIFYLNISKNQILTI